MDWACNTREKRGIIQIVMENGVPGSILKQKTGYVHCLLCGFV
jgi:hypothetical protein